MPLLYGDKIARESVDEDKKISQKVFNKVLGAIKRYDESDTGELKALMTGTPGNVPSVLERGDIQQPLQPSVSNVGNVEAVNNSLEQLRNEIDKQKKVYDANINKRDYIEETKLIADNVAMLDDKGIVDAYNQFASDVRNNNFVVSKKQVKDVLKSFKDLEVAINRSINLRVNDTSKNIYSYDEMHKALNEFSKETGDEYYTSDGMLNLENLQDIERTDLPTFKKIFLKLNANRANLLNTFGDYKNLARKRMPIGKFENLEKKENIQQLISDLEYARAEGDIDDEEHKKLKDELKHDYNLTERQYIEIFNLEPELETGKMVNKYVIDQRDFSIALDDFKRMQELYLEAQNEYLDEKILNEDEQLDENDLKAIDDIAKKKIIDENLNWEFFKKYRNSKIIEKELLRYFLSNPYITSSREQDKLERRHTYKGKKEREKEISEKLVNEQVFDNIIISRIKSMSHFIVMCIKTTAICLFGIDNINDMEFKEYDDVTENKYISAVKKMFVDNDVSPIAVNFKGTKYALTNIDQLITSDDKSELIEKGRQHVRKQLGKGKAKINKTDKPEKLKLIQYGLGYHDADNELYEKDKYDN